MMVRRTLGGLALSVLAALLALVPASAPAVAQDGSLSVNLARARTSFGVMNTDLIQFGTLFVRPRTSASMTQLDTLSFAPEALQTPVTADAVTLTDIKGLEIGVSLASWILGDVAQIQAEARRNASIYIKKVVTERLRSPLRVLNADTMRENRKFYASSYKGDFVYELAYDVTRVDEGGLGFGRPFKVGARLAFPSKVAIKGLNLDVSYANSSIAAFEGSGTPMFYKTQSFRLVPDGDDFKFVPYTPPQPRR